MVRPKEMDDILREIGWTDGFNIPAISDENKELENEVSKMLQEKASLLASVRELDELLTSVSSHTKELKAECAQNESLLTEQQAQLEHEGSLVKLLQAEEARLNNAILLERQTRSIIEERCARVEAQLSARQSSARGAERDVESGQLVRGVWEEQEAQASLATKTLVDYYKQDEAKLKELELQRARLQTDVTRRCHELQELASTVGALERQLDSAARQYRAGLAERRALMSRWEASAAAVKAREQASRHVALELAELREALRASDEQLREARDFEEDETRHNQELEARARGLATQVARLKEALRGQRTLRDALQEETVTMSCQLAGCESEISAEKMRICELDALLAEREARGEQLRQACEERSKRLQLLGELQGGAGERVARLHTIQQEKQREAAELRKRGERLDLETARANQELQRLRQAEKAAEASVGAQQAALRQLAARRVALERELERHRDMLLCLELSVQRQQLRASRLAADKPSDTEDPKLLDKERKLQSVLLDKQATRDLLRKELVNVERTERQLKVECSSSAEQLQELREAERALQAAVDGGTTREDDMSAREGDARARLALLQARVSKRRGDVAEARNAVLHLRTAALQIEHASKLQSGELGVETSALRADLAGAEQENAQLRAAIAQRKLRLQQLQNTYDIIVTTMEHGESGLNIMGGDLVESATEFITRQRIRVAQEKGELVQRGNSLDAEIRRAEREIRALEHTLALVKAANDRYRGSLALPGSATAAVEDASDPELQAQFDLELQRQRDLRAELKMVRDTEERMQHASKQLRLEVAAATEEQRSLASSYAEREHEISEVQRELAEQQVKLRRATNQTRRLSRELRGGNQAQATFEERDLEAREMKRVTAAALRELWALGQQHVEARPLIARYLEEKGLPQQSVDPRQLARRTSSRQSLDNHAAGSPALLNVHFPEAASPAGSARSEPSKKTV